MLGNTAIYDWHNNDGQNYVELAQALRTSETWFSVPDLYDQMPLSALGLPLYSLVFTLAQEIAGRFWMEALIAAEVAAVIYVSFRLYLAVALFSELWILGLAAAYPCDAAGLLWNKQFSGERPDCRAGPSLTTIDKLDSPTCP